MQIVCSFKILSLKQKKYSLCDILPKKSIKNHTKRLKDKTKKAR